MDKEIEIIGQNENKENAEACLKLFKEKDYVSAFRMFWNLSEEEKVPVLLSVADFYSASENRIYEFNTILKMITLPESVGNDPLQILNRICYYILPYLGQSLSSYYKDMIAEYFDVDPDSLFENGSEMVQVVNNQQEAPKDAREPLRLCGCDGGKFYLDQAKIYAGKNKFDEAIECLLNINKSEPFYVEAQLLLSMLALSVGNVELSFSSAKNVLDINPKNQSAVDRLAEIQKQTSKLSKEIDEYLSNLDIDAKDFCNLMLKAESLSRVGRVNDAIELIKSLDGINKYNEQLLETLASYYMLDKRYEEASEVLSTLCAIYPCNVKARYRLKSIEMGKPDGLFNTNGYVGLVKQMKNEVNSFYHLTKDEYFKLTRQELNYYYQISLAYSDDMDFKKFAMIMLADERILDIILDSLIQVSVSDRKRQIIISSIIQLGTCGQADCLIADKMKKLKFEYPEVLYKDKLFASIYGIGREVKFTKKNKEEVEERLDLVNGFSQSYTISLFSGENCDNFKKAGSQFYKIYTASNIQEKEILRNIDAMVFSYCYLNNKEMTHLKKYYFKIFNLENKDEIIDIIERYKNL